MKQNNIDTGPHFTLGVLKI